MQTDVLILGGGAAGLSLALTLADTNLNVTLIERQSSDELEQLPYDGREIALTHFSKQWLSTHGVWERFPANGISPIRQAKVLDGASPYALQFDCDEGGKADALGYLVSHHDIRRSLYQAVLDSGKVEMLTGTEVVSSQTGRDGASVTLADGRTIDCKLLVAADSRFSPTRRRHGIPAQMRDFGRTMLVGRVQHERPHENVAYECFGYGNTLAILPLDGNSSSAVLTVPAEKADEVCAMSPAAYSAYLTDLFRGKLGTMTQDGEVYPYPLVATYADRFATRRLALLGDASVGMHPVTAHGFNLGLKGAQSLAGEIKKAAGRGRDIGSSSVLSAYDRTHRRATRPLYLGTNALVRLYNDGSLPARLVRPAFLRLSNRVMPVKREITRRLMEVASPG